MAEYVERGFPSPARPWRGADYRAAAEALARFPASDRHAVPRYGGADAAGIVFARMTSSENLRFVQTGALPLDNRIGEGIELMQGVKDLLLGYYKLGKSGPAFPGELIELQAYVLDCALAFTGVVREFASTLSPSDPTYPARMEGMARARSGLGTMINGALVTLEETSFYPGADLARFARHLSRTLPPLLAEFPASMSQEARRRLQKRHATAEEPLRSAIAELLAALADDE